MQYDTTGRMTLCSMILGGDFYEKNSKIKIILTHWSVSDPGSNDEKKLEVKILVGMSF